MWRDMRGRAAKKRRMWWSEKVGVVVAEKRSAFKNWLQKRDRVTYDRYLAQKAVVKLTVKVAKKNGELAMWRVTGVLFRG